MKLIEFRVLNYRSVNDSGVIDVAKLTTLVGRNESGKSNLLLALHSLNPVGGFVALSKIKNFPRGRRLTECTDETPVVRSRWQLDNAEQAELATKYPRAKGVTSVELTRPYGAKRSIVFEKISEFNFRADDVAARVDRVANAAVAISEKLDAEPKAKVIAAVAAFKAALQPKDTTESWAIAATAGLPEFRKAVAVVGGLLGKSEDGALAELEALAATIVNDPKNAQEAANWIATKLPIFVYVDEYAELNGHQNIAEYLARKNQNQLTEPDRNFEKMCKVADLNPQQLHDLLGQNDPETRNQLVNRAGAVVTSELRRLWKDRPLKVRFNIDSNFLDTFISDPNSLYDVDVNLDERSRGFKWFFSFYVTFAADTKGGPATDAILLLDEPGLYLHMTSQNDLLKHFDADYQNQIIYTTHSPYMIPTHNLDAIRTVNIDSDAGTTVTNDPTGDSRTLFPLQAALGFHLAQSLFVAPNNLVVEGVTDFWILSSISEHLLSGGNRGLPKETVITPAGGAPKVTYMVALLSSQKLNVLVLLDEEKQGRAARDEMVKAKLIRDDNILFVSDSFDAPQPTEADIEDVIDPIVYGTLVEQSYKDELRGKKLGLNAKIPRIVKRYEEAFGAIGLEFQKTRPARLLLNKMANDSGTIMTADTTARFVRLFGKIDEALRKHVARNTGSFR